MEVCEDMFPLTLAKLELTLGVQWLEKFGTILTNYKIQKMTFDLGRQPVKLVGDPSEQ